MDTVCFGCSLPNGLHMENREADGVAKVRFTLFGGAKHIGVDDLRGVVRIGKYALTDGVPKDFAVRWMKENASSPLVNGQTPMIFMEPDPARAAARARELQGIRTGLEPIPAFKTAAAEIDPRLKEFKAIAPADRAA